jgi:hypothetical protein
VSKEWRWFSIRSNPLQKGETTLQINKLAGWCLIVFGIINVLHEISLRTLGRREPGTGYALFTALLFTAGAAAL